jgi:ATP-dependent RNA helicase DHX37/DHR1
MYQPRVGYNDRARGSTAGGKKKGKRRSKPSIVTSEQVDPNAIIHVPKTVEEREMEKKERMKQEVCFYRGRLLLLF